MAYDFDLFVIGAGSGGVRAARFAAGYGARVAVALLMRILVHFCEFCHRARTRRHQTC